MSMTATQKSVSSVLILKLFGLCLIVLIIGLLNIIDAYVMSSVFTSVVHFLNGNLLLILAFSFMFLLAEVFERLKTPYQLAYPVFNAFGAVLLVDFFLKIFSWSVNEVGVDIFVPESIRSLVVILVAVIVLLVGYMNVYGREEELVEQPEKQSKRRAKPSDVSWGDVGEEFREAIMDLLKTFRAWLKKR